MPLGAPHHSAYRRVGIPCQQGQSPFNPEPSLLTWSSLVAHLSSEWLPLLLGGSVFSKGASGHHGLCMAN